MPLVPEKNSTSIISPVAAPQPMKFWASVWLVISVLVFIVAALLEHRYPVLVYLRAFAEGALVGGLADWFAVTALFSHPLGLPIPHTAIIPKRKNEIGTRLGSFIQTHFLRARVIQEKLDEMKITARLLHWLATEKGSQALVQQSAQLTEWLLLSLEDEKIRDFLHRHILGQLRNIDVAPMIGDVLQILTANDRHRELFDKGISIAAEVVEQYKPTIKQKLDKEIPWWAFFMRDIAYEKLVGNIGQTLTDMKNDPNHAARLRFDSYIAKFIDDLHHSPELRQKCAEIKEKVLQDPVVQDYVAGLWSEIKSLILTQAADPDSKLRRTCVEWIQKTVLALQQETVIMDKIERNFQIVVARTVEKYNHEVARLIEQEVQRWDTQLTSRLIEDQIGNDLQWIRINGTLVGGLAGLLIYLASLGLASLNI